MITTRKLLWLNYWKLDFFFTIIEPWIIHIFFSLLGALVIIVVPPCFYLTIYLLNSSLLIYEIIYLTNIYWVLTTILREGNGNPLQYSCLENSVNRTDPLLSMGSQSWTWLKRLSMHVCIGEGNGNPLQCSCLENPRDRGAWWAAVYGVAQSQTQQKWLAAAAAATVLDTSDTTVNEKVSLFSRNFHSMRSFLGHGGESFFLTIPWTVNRLTSFLQGEIFLFFFLIDYLLLSHTFSVFNFIFFNHSVVSGSLWLCDIMDYTCQAPLSMDFSRQEYWSGLPFFSPGDLPDPRIKPGSLTWQAFFLLSESPGKSL